MKLDSWEMSIHYWIWKVTTFLTHIHLIPRCWAPGVFKLIIWKVTQFKGFPGSHPFKGCLQPGLFVDSFLWPETQRHKTFFLQSFEWLRESLGGSLKPQATFNMGAGQFQGQVELFFGVGIFHRGDRDWQLQLAPWDALAIRKKRISIELPGSPL